MMKITNLDQLINLAGNGSKETLIVASAANEEVLLAVKQAIERKIVRAILVGDENEIRRIAQSVKFDLDNTEIINVPIIDQIAEVSVKAINNGKAGILMKGFIQTGTLLKAVLNREYGLRKSETVSHLAIFQTSFYPKLLGITDAAMNINPSVEEKIRIIENAVEVFYRIGIQEPRVALLSALEYVNEKIQSSVDAKTIVELKPEIPGRRYHLDGPLALDNAISIKAASVKGIESNVAGKADILIAPELNSGNILYKSLRFLSDGIAASMICGASVPIVLNSRADTEKSKLYSIALATVFKNLRLWD